MTAEPYDPAQDRRLIEAAVEAQRDDLRRLAARYRAGAMANDLEELLKPMGVQRASASAVVALRYLVLLLESLDDGPDDREWRQRTYGEAASS